MPVARPRVHAAPLLEAPEGVVGGGDARQRPVLRRVGDQVDGGAAHLVHGVGERAAPGDGGLIGPRGDQAASHGAATPAISALASSATAAGRENTETTAPGHRL